MKLKIMLVSILFSIFCIFNVNVSAEEAPQITSNETKIVQTKKDENNNTVTIFSERSLEKPSTRGSVVDNDKPNTELTQVTYISKNKEDYNNMIKSLNKSDLALYATDPSRFDERWDSSYSVRIYSTVNVKKKYRYDGVPLAKFYSAYGGYVINDKQVSVTRQHVILKASGVVENGGTTLNRREYENKNSYWVYYAPTNWKYLNLNASSTELGVSQTVYLKRFNSNWSVNLVNFFI